mgnify:FL=1
MSIETHNQIVSFIWSIADVCLRDVYVRGKYRDVILPMVVLRRLDALLEKTHQEVLEEYHYQINELKYIQPIAEDLCMVSGYNFYNTSKWTLKELARTAGNSKQILVENFQEYLDGFSDNVKEIINCFKLRDKIQHLADKERLLLTIQMFTSPDINLSTEERENSEGRTLAPLTNLGMGYVFEELIRKFNEENNEEAGEHFTPREVIQLMTNLAILPVRNEIPPVIQIYDPACGTGGMLTESQNFVAEIKPDTKVVLYGKEINDETYAICKSDMIIKGDSPKYIRSGSTLATDEFGGTTFNFMLSNPPYGKNWNADVPSIKEGREIIDPRFKVSLPDYWGNEEVMDATPRTSDGQLLFLMEMVSKMKSISKVTPLGSRIASVHNGSSLFTGDAGSGESNIRRYIIENDLLEAIVQLPNNIFYNTGITTYIWLLSNNKKPQNRGKVILIDASEQYATLRKNLGQKNCELRQEHIDRITEAYLTMESIEPENEGDLAAQVFNNSDFGYYKITIDRPDRRRVQFTPEAIAALRYDRRLEEVMRVVHRELGDVVFTKDLAKYKKEIEDICEVNEFELTKRESNRLLSPKLWLQGKELYAVACELMEKIGTAVSYDFNAFQKQFDKVWKQLETPVQVIKLNASNKKAILDAISVYDEKGEKVVKRIEKLRGTKLAKLLEQCKCTLEELPHYGYYPTGKEGEFITYETCSDLRDYENIPLKEEVLTYYLREVKPYVDEAWISIDNARIGYEISFNKYFYRHQSLRSLQEVSQDILEIEQASDGLIRKILNF